MATSLGEIDFITILVPIMGNLYKFPFDNLRSIYVGRLNMPH